MEIELSLTSRQLTKEELQQLLQSIRDCEQAFFPDKEMVIIIESPELTSAECTEILTSIEPPYADLTIIGRREY